MEFSRKACAIQASVTLGIDALAKKLKAEGRDVVGFGAGEPDFETPQYIKDAALLAMQQGKTRYTPSSGTPELQAAIADKLQRENGLVYAPEQIVVSNGAKHSLFNALQAISNPGDEVLLPAPYWVSYYELIRMADAVPVIIETSPATFRPDPADVLKAITPRTKAFILNSPNNPTGAVYPAGLLKQLAELAVEHNFFIISDEIYESLIYGNEKHVSVASFSPEVMERTIVVNGVSKSFAMTGWRIGYTASSKQAAKIMGNFQSHATSNPNSIAQAASVAALRDDHGFRALMREEFRSRRDTMHARLNAIPGLYARLPEGAFYLFLQVNGLFGKTFEGKPLQSAMEISNALLSGFNCAVVPGEAFGAPQFVRLSYATDRQSIEKGMERIARFVSSLE